MSSRALLVLCVAACGGASTTEALPDAGPGAAPTEIGVGPTVDGPATDSQLGVALVRGAGGWLLVWQDDRRDEGGDIYAARVGEDGGILDPHGFAVGTVGGTQYEPRVAFGGGLFLVVWSDYGDGQVRAARVSPSGEVLDPAGIDLAGGHSPDVAFDGAEFVVVLAGGADRDVLVTRVTPLGEVREPGGTSITLAAGWQGLPSIAAGPPGTLLVSWVDVEGDGGGDDAEAATVTLFAGLLGAEPSPEADGVDGEPARLAFDGEHFAITWSAGGDVFARRVGIDAQPIVIAAGPGVQGGADIGFDGERFVLAWHHQTDPDDRTAFDIRAAWLAPDGTTHPLSVPATAGQQARPAVGGALLAWDGLSDEPWDIFAARVGADGTVGAVQRVTSSANAQGAPRLAGDLLVYVSGGRVFRDGQPLVDGDGRMAQPAIAPGLVAFMRWSDARSVWEIAATRLTDGGQARDPQGLFVVGEPKLQYSPAVAGSFVVWTDERPAREYSTISGALVTPDGTVGPAFAVADGDLPASAPAVAWGAGVYLVAWYRLDAPSYSTGAAIDFAVLSPAGAVLARGTLGSPDDRRNRTDPQVAFDGENFLVVWEMHLHTGWNIRATRVTPAGAVLDAQGIAISDAPAADGALLIQPSVVFAGGSYLIGWQDEFLSRLETRRLGKDGTLLGAAPRLVTGGGLGQRSLTLGVAADGTVTAAYERFDAAAGTWRVFHRALDAGAP